MEKYSISGMSCAACSARIEKAVSSVEGVKTCSVNLLTNSMNVDGTAESGDIIKAVEAAGYGASVSNVRDGVNTEIKSGDDFLSDRETPVLKRRFLSSLVFLVTLMYFSMGHTMFGLLLPPFFEGNPVAVGLVQLILASVVMIINSKFFVSGYKGAVNKSPNMDTLVSLGSGASFAYSVYGLFAMSDALVKGDVNLAMSYMHELYFESAAMILCLITLGKMLEARSKGKTTDAIKSLMNLSPKTAIVVEDRKEREIPTSEIKKGDIFVVKPGALVPADGVIIEGHCAIDESALTGESIPVDKMEGDTVSAATVNQTGFIKCEAVKVGEDTALSQIIRMVTDASATKAPIAKVADKVSGVFVPVVILIALLSTVIWIICGESFGFALARGISVLVISCPCALGLATPVAIMVGNGVGAKNGILFKNAESLEQTGKIENVALDKTGTITSGEPRVTDIIPADGISEEELMQAAFSLEIKSEHPLAVAVVKKAADMALTPDESQEFELYPGNGLSAVVRGERIIGGNKTFVSKSIPLSEEITDIADTLSIQGKTPLFFCREDTFIGIIAVADTIKDDSAQAISQLKNMGIRVIMLTGDNEKTANAVKEKTGVDEVIAGVSPAGKEIVIKELKRRGKTAMVGDGINDAPALTTADIGIAIGAGTEVAINAADIVLMKNSLSDVVSSIRLSRATLKNIHQNLFWAFIYNIIGIPLAAGLWIPLLGLRLNPMFGAAAMSLSSFCVVTNALRLNLFNIRNSDKDKKIKIKKEENTMEKTMKIEGMMCGHCEARVKKCLEEIDGVSEAVVSHESGNAIVKLAKDVPYETLKAVVEGQGYKVID